ncbi:MAG: 3'-5' exonuclease [Pseudomonadota bacterium]
MEIALQQYQHFLIVDLEATCCNKGSIPKYEMETIEIGAVIIEATKLIAINEFSIFIRPVRHKILTPFCTKLTTITQQDVDGALTYPNAISIFKEWLYQYENFLFCSWGDYDNTQLQRDSDFHQVPFPIGAPHVNIKKLFSSTQGLRKKYGMTKALKAAKLELQGTHHRGIDDARNMGRLMPYILGRKPLPSNHSSEIAEVKNIRTE